MNKKQLKKSSITDTTSKIVSSLVATAVVLFTMSPLQAAIVEVQQKDWDKGKKAVCCDTSFDVRYGNNALNGDSELAANGGAASPTAQHQYQNGVSQAFTLTHNSTTGDFVFRIGDSAPVLLDMPELTAWETIGVLVKTKNKKGFESRLDNLMLDLGSGGQYSFVSDRLISAGKNSSAIVLTDDAGGYFSNFTLSGDMTFSWGKGKAKKEDLLFSIGVADAVVAPVPLPVPAAFWLFGSALGVFVAIRRRNALFTRRAQ